MPLFAAMTSTALRPSKMSSTATRAPSLAMRTAVLYPIPSVPPVTAATLPSSRPIIRLHSLVDSLSMSYLTQTPNLDYLAQPILSIINSRWPAHPALPRVHGSCKDRRQVDSIHAHMQRPVSDAVHNHLANCLVRTMQGIPSTGEVCVRACKAADMQFINDCVALVLVAEPGCTLLRDVLRNKAKWRLTGVRPRPTSCHAIHSGRKENFPGVRIQKYFRVVKGMPLEPASK